MQVIAERSHDHAMALEKPEHHHRCVDEAYDGVVADEEGGAVRTSRAAATSSAEGDVQLISVMFVDRGRCTDAIRRVLAVE